MGRPLTRLGIVGFDMPPVHDFESSLTASREEVAAVLHSVAEGVTAGSIRLGSGDDAIVVDLPDAVTLETEFEEEDDEVSLELELEWPPSEGRVEAAAGTVTQGPDTEDDEGVATPVRPADPREPPARFEVFRDRNDEWRWRLVHRNGNIIATSGEGYTRKHNARKGLRSVVRNAPFAGITEPTDIDS